MTLHGIFQARVLEWGAIAFSDAALQELFIEDMWRITQLGQKRELIDNKKKHKYTLLSEVKWNEVKVTQSCLILCNPMDYQSVEFSRPEYWSE